MVEFLSGLSLFPLVLTFGAYQLALWLQKKGKSPLLNPILVASILVILILFLTGILNETFQEGSRLMTWLLTLVAIPLLYPILAAIEKIGGETWKE